jgi:hypothetical protein
MLPEPLASSRLLNRRTSCQVREMRLSQRALIEVDLERRIEPSSRSGIASLIAERTDSPICDRPLAWSVTLWTLKGHDFSSFIIAREGERV